MIRESGKNVGAIEPGEYFLNLTRYSTKEGSRWNLEGAMLPQGVTLGFLLGMTRDEMHRVLAALPRQSHDGAEILSPAETELEVWAAGVTYLRSRNERQAESTVADVYGRVYDAARPELFFKTLGWRSRGTGQTIRIRSDSTWNVPEPELTLVINRHGEIVGFTAGNDVSSRSIEGENPLYLPQAKSYDGSCALGPSIVLSSSDALNDIPIECKVIRENHQAFFGQARTSQMKRPITDLVEHLFRECSFPNGVFLMTGTGIVPDQSFTLLPGDLVTVTADMLALTNEVELKD